MTRILITALVLSFFINLALAATEKPNNKHLAHSIGEIKSTVSISFEDSGDRKFSTKERLATTNAIRQAEIKIRKLLPSLSKKINVNVSILDRDLLNVGGVTGRADSPERVLIQISNQYPGGLLAAIEAGVSSTVYHEFHHLVRGWTMQGNKFGPGIAIAAVNEGLASVFAEIHTGQEFPGNAYPSDVKTWIPEILDLPENAPYGYWMMDTQPDGRGQVGYRAGRYIIHQAMKNSEKSVLELSQYSPFQILEMSGLIEHHAASIAKLAQHYEFNNDSKQAISYYHKALKIAQNNADPNAQTYANKIKLLKNPIKLSIDLLALYSGSYESQQINFHIRKEGNQLFGEVEGGPTFRMYPEKQNVFYIRESSSKFEFVKAESGKIDSLIYHARGRELNLKRVD